MADYTTIEQVKIRLKHFHVNTVENDDGTTSDVVEFDRKDENPLIEMLIQQAISDVKAARKYPDDYTEEMIVADMENYNSIVVSLAAYDRMKSGSDFQGSDSENGKSRTWNEREKLLSSVCPIARII